MEEGFSFKSEASTSMIVEGLAFLTALITWAKCAAAPSGKSSRVTMVITAWRASCARRLPPRAAILQDPAAGLAVGGAESAGARAPFSGNHERGRTLVPTFITVGQCASSQTVKRFLPSTSCLTSQNSRPLGRLNLDPRRFAFRSFRSLIVVPAFHSPASLP